MQRSYGFEHYFIECVAKGLAYIESYYAYFRAEIGSGIEELSVLAQVSKSDTKD